VAKELKRIKKTRMISELNNLALLEDERAGKQFYGAQAYQDWLGSKGLEVDQKTGNLNYVCMCIFLDETLVSLCMGVSS